MLIELSHNSGHMHQVPITKPNPSWELIVTEDTPINA